MSRKPKNLPDEGDRVRLRGRDAVGVLEKLSNDWAMIRWDQEKAGPLICHLHELEKLAA